MCARDNFTFSFIIPHKPQESAPDLVSHLKKIDYPLENIEVIIVEGRHPSLQRNVGANVAKGEILFFLDYDCIPSPCLLREVLSGFMADKGDIAAVGGPCILHPKNSLNLLFKHTLVSFFSHYRMRARYMKLGDTRDSDERELIGCNLSVKKRVFENVGGFKEVLYPNEENEFLNRLKLDNYRIIYNPEAVVAKEVKWSVIEYAKKMFKYGNGRGREFFEEPINLNLMYLMPVFFCFYLASLIFVHNYKYSILLLVYMAIALSSGLIYMHRQGKVVLSLISPFVFILMHVSYGLGTLYSILKRIARLGEGGKVTEIKVKTIKRLGSNDFSDEASSEDIEYK